jgi:predicted ATPase
MAAAVLAADALPEGLRAVIGAKAEGNPFYVEELVKSLEESGALRREGGGLALTRSLTAVAVRSIRHHCCSDRPPAEAPSGLQLAR